jgi:tetratricopeptide (TPR) repeat protein
MAFTGRYLEAERELQETRSLLENTNAPILEMKRANLQGLVAWKQGHLKKAVQPLIQCLDWAHRSEMPYFASNAYNNLGLIYGNMGQPRLAIEYHERALKMREEARDEMGQAASSNNLGIIYENLGEYEKAEEHYHRALQLAEKTEYREVETAVLANLGQLAESKGQLAKALQLNARSLHHARLNGDTRSEAIALDNMGDVNYRLRHYEAAETKYHEALARAGEMGDNTVRSRALLGLCRLYTEQKKLAAAREAWQLARDIIDPCGMEESKPRLFRYLARWLMAENQPEEALQAAANGIESAQANRHPIEEKACQEVFEEIKKTLDENKS